MCLLGKALANDIYMLSFDKNVLHSVHAWLSLKYFRFLWL